MLKWFQKYTSKRQTSHIEQISSGRYNGSCKENTGETKIWT